ncbi:response regulator [Streptomyces olivoreticuli]|uniref:response regulator n=1 Tax=Streptomyces olivoreticuli TaxID=68246 RepID=UPI000E263981|nr:response regulator transcription factor [Streptomyces olivoreticuli]
MTAPVTVVLVDDHLTVRAGTRALLEPEGFVVVGEAAGEPEAIDLVSTSRPDLLVLDMVLESGPVLSAIPALLAAAPKMGILVHSMYEDAALVRGALAAGASGYLSKSTSVPELVLAARTVAIGGSYVQPPLGADMAHVPVPQKALSPREEQVLVLLADGHTNREVAGRLTLSVRTVESLRAALRNRLGLVTRADLVAYARRTGLIHEAQGSHG